VNLYTAEQIRRIEDNAERLGLSRLTLMRRASRAVADAALKYLQPGDAVCVICGTGNNGGDGVGAAAQLLRHGFDVTTYIFGDISKISEQYREMLRLVREYGGEIKDGGAKSAVLGDIESSALVIDALFGIGLTRDLQQDFADIFYHAERKRVPVISVDIPSGIDADTGTIRAHCADAVETITFIGRKIGTFVTPGASYSGKVTLCDLGLPQEAFENVASDIRLTQPDDVFVRDRTMDSHKGSYGRVLVIAGSVGYSGAPVLAAKAATRTGTGLVFLGVPAGIYEIAAQNCSGEVVFPISDGGETDYDSFEKIAEKLSKADAVVIGPGLRNTDAARKLVENVLSGCTCPVILDADGINAICGNINVIDKASCPVILTPHEGEFFRLGGDTSGGRLQAAVNFANTHKCYMVLKGAGTIVASPGGLAYINTTGSGALAKGGSGDVLAGMIASLAAVNHIEHVDLLQACVSAVWLHGKAGETAADKYGEHSIDAAMLIDSIGDAISSLSEDPECEDTLDPIYFL